MRDIPYSVLATWPIPNYTDPVTFGDAALIVNIIFMAISTVAVSLRIFVRWYMRRWLGWDDFWCVLGLVFGLGFSLATVLADYVYGSNVHIWDIRPSDLQSALKIAMATKVLFTCAGTAIRQSLLCFYLRLIGEVGMKRFRWAIHAATAFNISVGICFTVLCIFQCTPVSAYWQFESKGCLDEGAITFSSGIIITACDVLTVLLPIPIILRLQMSWRTKLGVSILLNLGLGASAAAAVRTYYIWKALVAYYDETWWAYPLWLAASVELHVSITAACAPAIRPFIAKHAPWLMTPVHKLGDLVSHIYNARKDARELSQGTTAVSTRDQLATARDVRIVDAPHYDDKKMPTVTSTENIAFEKSSAIERGNESDDSDDFVHDRHARGISQASLDKEEVLQAVSQAIRGVGTLPANLFEQHTRPSTSARSSHERQRRQGLVERSHVVPIIGPGSTEERTGNFSFAGSVIDGDVGLDGSERTPTTRNNAARDTEAQIPGGNAYGFIDHSQRLGYTAGNSRQPRATSAERSQKNMPNAFWNRERARNGKTGRQRSKSLDSSLQDSDEEVERRSRQPKHAAQKYASGLSGASSVVDPLTASIIRQYSVRGQKRTVDISGSAFRTENTPAEKWPQVTMRKEKLPHQSTAEFEPTSDQAWQQWQQRLSRQTRHPQQYSGQVSSSRISGDGQRLSHSQLTAIPSTHTSFTHNARITHTPPPQPSSNRIPASQEPPRVVRGIPGLSEQGVQRLMQQQQQDSESSEESTTDSSPQPVSDDFTRGRMFTTAPLPSPSARESQRPMPETRMQSSVQQVSHRAQNSGESVSSSVQDVKKTFLFDESVDGNDGEEASHEMDRLRREMARRSRMLGRKG